MDSTFKVNDLVTKVTGDYEWDGIVSAVFLTPQKKPRIVVAHPVNRGYVLHIYAPNNLQPIDPLNRRRVEQLATACAYAEGDV